MQCLTSILQDAQTCCVFTCISDGLVLLQLSQQRSSRLDIAELSFFTYLVAPQKIVVLVAFIPGNVFFDKANDSDSPVFTSAFACCKRAMVSLRSVAECLLMTTCR